MSGSLSSFGLRACWQGNCPVKPQEFNPCEICEHLDEERFILLLWVVDKMRNRDRKPIWVSSGECCLEKGL